MKAVGKSDKFVWNNVHKGIPGGCSVRGHDHGHYDKRGYVGTVGTGRKDLRAVCVKNYYSKNGNDKGSTRLCRNK